MQAQYHNSTLVVSVYDHEIPDIADKVVGTLESHGMFQRKNIFRQVYLGDTATILEHGTDRFREQSIDHHIWVSGVIRDGEERVKACKVCVNENTFDDVVVDTNFMGEKRLVIRCPYQKTAKVDNRYIDHMECPIYSVISDGPQVFFGSDPTSNYVHPVTNMETVRDFLSKLHRDTRHLLLYDSDKVEPFNSEKFNFKGSVERVDSLKAVIEILEE